LGYNISQATFKGFEIYTAYTAIITDMCSTVVERHYFEGKLSLFYGAGPAADG